MVGIKGPFMLGCSGRNIREQLVLCLVFMNKVVCGRVYLGEYVCV